MESPKQAIYPIWLMILVGLLAVIAVIQAWWIYYMQSSTNSSTAITLEEGEHRPHVPDINSGLFPGVAPNATWNPYFELQSIRERMDQIFGQAFQELNSSSEFGGMFDHSYLQSPRINMRETDEAYEVSVDLPGAEASEITTSIEDQVLTVSATTNLEQESTEETTGEQYHYLERRTGKFARSIPLPGPVDPQGMTSELKDGVLRIHIPKR